jgi:NhaP-type Na+/H+ or K+/H+ antiporter
LDTNDVLIAGVGTVAWALALVVLLLIKLPAGDRWWLWVCAAGIAGGLFGMWYIPRLQRKRAERVQSHQGAEGDELASGDSTQNGAAQSDSPQGDSAQSDSAQSGTAQDDRHARDGRRDR